MLNFQVVGDGGKGETNAHQMYWTYSLLAFHRVVSQMAPASQWLPAVGEGSEFFIFKLMII